MDGIEYSLTPRSPLSRPVAHPSFARLSLHLHGNLDFPYQPPIASLLASAAVFCTESTPLGPSSTSPCRLQSRLGSKRRGARVPAIEAGTSSGLVVPSLPVCPSVAVPFTVPRLVAPAVCQEVSSSWQSCSFPQQCHHSQEQASQVRSASSFHCIPSVGTLRSGGIWKDLGEYLGRSR
jgi:hypothetical protein